MRKNISLSDEIEKRAEAIMKARGFAGLSDMIAGLVREEYERRHPPALKEDATNANSPRTSGKPLDSYTEDLRRRRKGRAK